MLEQINLTLAIALATYLVPAVASALAALAAWQTFQRLRENTWRQIGLAFLTITALQLAMLGIRQIVNVPIPITRAFDLASAAIIASAFLDRRQVTFLLVTLSATGVLAAFDLSLFQLSQSEPLAVAAAWQVGGALLYGATAVRLWKRQEHVPLLWAALGLLAVDTLTGMPGLTAIWLAVRLVAFPLLPVALMYTATQDLEGVQAELQSFSEYSLRQTQQLLTLLRTSSTLVDEFDVENSLREAAEAVAVAMEADNTLIALLEEDPGRMAHVQATYPAMPGLGRTFPLSSQPAIAQAVDSCAQANLGEADPGAEALAVLANSSPGPAMVQPMVYQDRALGVIVVLNGRSRRAFAEGELKVLEAFAAQVTASVQNAFLYSRLDAQAHELARLLAQREEEAGRQAAILESIADGVIVTDPQDQVVLANAAATGILGCVADELLGRPFGAVLSELAPVRGQAIWGEAEAHGQDALRAIFQVGARYVQSSLAPVLGANQQHLGTVTVLRDITAERAAEDAKSEFISTISHELRTPLTSVKGYADLIASGAVGPLTPSQGNFVQAIRTGAERLAAIVNAVIQFSEIEKQSIQVRQQRVDLDRLLQEVIVACRPQADECRHALKLWLLDDLPQVRADPDYVKQIIAQLLDNATRFTPPGGRIEVSSRLAREEENNRQPSVVIEVRDTGVGLTLPEQERCFQRFYRGESPMQVPAGGLGIGLSIARALAQVQGGQLVAESPGATEDKPGQGSIFRLSLPIASSWTVDTGNYEDLSLET